MKSSIILVRHGESLGNLSQRYFDVHDSANILTQKGVEQCLALKDKMPSLMTKDPFGTHTTVISSKHQRAKLTAEIVMQGTHLPIIHDARLNECWHDSDTGKHGTFYNIEPREFVVDRVKRLVDQHEFNLILFCHGVLMDVLDPQGREVENCEVRKYDRKDFIERILA